MRKIDEESKVGFGSKLRGAQKTLVKDAATENLPESKKRDRLEFSRQQIVM